MRKLFSVLFFSLLSITGFTQNTNISGVINTYTSVTNIVGNTVSVSSSSGFSAGDLVLIIQMQGATMDSSNSSSFGDILNYNSAGNYEFSRICNIVSGTEIELTAVQRSYEIAGNVQVIRVPEYIDATVTGTLTADPWNGQTGGVLVLDCSGTLTLNADVDLQGMGFRGGGTTTSGYNCSWLVNVGGYFYDISTGQGAKKGEGIALYQQGKTSGRGAQTNGGGGGNDHNSGGGGGSNAGLGGNGGQRIPAGTFNCSGSNPGRGGEEIAYSTFNDKVFMGGGGGAGHENNSNVGTPGANGGGIIIIRANTLVTNSNTFNVKGQDITSNAADGAGGGGAGGSVLFDISGFSTPLNIMINGSDGGDVSNVGSSNCNGPGGGGSGGVFRYSGTTFPPNTTTNLSGGQSGTTVATSQSNCTLGGTNGAQGGDNALTFSGLTFYEPVNTIFSVQETTSICAGDSLFLEGNWQSIQGVYYDTISYNCTDSVTETTLNILPELTGTLNQTLCFGDSVVVNGTTYSSSVTGVEEVFVAGGQNGCDSTVTINLLVLPEVTGVDIQTACNSYIWIDGNTYNSNNNTAMHTIENGAANGCDSVVTLDLTINSVDVSTTINQSTISANANGAVYQWLDCDDNYNPITGETNQSFDVILSGNYAVEVTENGCTDTSACEIISTAGLFENGALDDVRIYPNPSQGEVNIYLGSLSDVSVKIRSIDQKLVYQQDNITTEYFMIDLNVNPGVYVIELITESGKKTSKLVFE